MGLELGSSKWACWKNARHRGRNAAFLIVALTGCSPETANELAGLQVAAATDELRAKFAALDDRPASETSKLSSYSIPDCFPLRPGSRRGAGFLRYLERRGLPAAAVERYGLLAADRGEFRGRVVLPISVGGRTVGATGRAVRKRDRRYHTLPSGVGSRALLLEQLATGGRLLIVGEGPYDAMTLDWAAHTGGLPAHAVALGGLALTVSKRLVLDRLSRRYDRIVLLLDATALQRALELQRELAGDVVVGQLPDGFGDAGDLDVDSARTLMSRWL